MPQYQREKEVGKEYNLVTRTIFIRSILKDGPWYSKNQAKISREYVMNQGFYQSLTKAIQNRLGCTLYGCVGRGFPLINNLTTSHYVSQWSNLNGEKLRSLALNSILKKETVLYTSWVNHRLTLKVEYIIALLNAE